MLRCIFERSIWLNLWAQLSDVMYASHLFFSSLHAFLPNAFRFCAISIYGFWERERQKWRKWMQMEENMNNKSICISWNNEHTYSCIACNFLLCFIVENGALLRDYIKRLPYFDELCVCIWVWVCSAFQSFHTHIKLHVMMAVSSEIALRLIF